MRTALMLLAALPLFAQPSDITPPVRPGMLPPQARQAMDRYDKAATEAKKVYDIAIAKAADAARKELARIQEAETKAGRLEAAMAVKDQIAGLPGDLVTTEIPKMYLDLAEKIENGTFTAAEWKDLPGVKFKVEAAAESNFSKIVLKKGEAYLVAPNPADKWKSNGSSAPFNYLGANASATGMRLKVKVGEIEIKGYLAEGEGALSMRASDTQVIDNVESITVKIIKIR